MRNSKTWALWCACVVLFPAFWFHGTKRETHPLMTFVPNFCLSAFEQSSKENAAAHPWLCMLMVSNKFFLHHVSLMNNVCHLSSSLAVFSSLASMNDVLLCLDEIPRKQQSTDFFVLKRTFELEEFVEFLETFFVNQMSWIDCLIGWLVGSSFHCFVVCLLDCLINWQVGWLVDQFDDCLIGLMIAWLINWLIEWLLMQTFWFCFCQFVTACFVKIHQCPPILQSRLNCQPNSINLHHHLTRAPDQRSQNFCHQKLCHVCQRENCNAWTIQIQPTTSCQLWQRSLPCLWTQTTFPHACKADQPQHWWVNHWWKSEPNTWSCHRFCWVQCLPSWCPTGSTVRTNKQKLFSICFQSTSLRNNSNNLLQISHSLLFSKTMRKWQKKGCCNTVLGMMMTAFF